MEPLHTLNNINNKFPITQIDNGNGNVTSVCQRFWAFVPLKTLPLDQIAIRPKKCTFKKIKLIIKFFLITLHL